MCHYRPLAKYLATGNPKLVGTREMKHYSTTKEFTSQVVFWNILVISRVQQQLKNLVVTKHVRDKAVQVRQVLGGFHVPISFKMIRTTQSELQHLMIIPFCY
jgi:hypothetical protein